MSKKLKILLVLALALLVLIGGAFYVVSTKIDPKVIKESAITAIEKNLRGVKAGIGEVSYNLGFTVKVNVTDLDITREKDGGKLLFVKNARVEVPILSILTNGGTVDVKVENPEFVLKELPGGSTNWQQALPEPKDEVQAKGEGSKVKEKVSEGKVEVPSFVEKSRIDLKITKLNFNYAPLRKKATEITVNKILLKNLNLKKTTAFEVVSKVNYGLDNTRSVSAAFQLVGEIALNNLLESGAVDTNMLLHVEDVNLSWMDLKVPDMKNVIKFKRDINGEINADVRASAGSSLNLETDVKVDKDFSKIIVGKLKTSFNLGSLKGILGSKSARSLEGVELGDSVFEAGGSAVVDLKNERLNPDLAFSVTKPVSAALAGQPVGVSFKGRFRGERFSVKVKNDLMSGTATVDASTKINPFKLPKKMSSYSPVQAKLLITNLKLEKPFIQKLIYGDKDEAAEDEKAPSEALPDEGASSAPAAIDFPPFNLDIEGKHIFVNKQEMNLSGKVVGRGSSVKSDGINMNYGSGKSRLLFNADLKNTENIGSTFGLVLNSMDMAGLNAFLPPLISEIKGRYGGKVAGSVSKKKELGYDVNVAVNAVNGELKNLNLSSFLLPLIEKISFLKGKVEEDKLKISDKFETMSLNAKATEKVVNIDNFTFVGNNKSVSLKAEGKVSMLETGDSRVEGKLVVTEIAGQVEALSDSSDIPLLLEGKGFSMLPDVKYTTDKLTERVAKKEIKKQKKKIEKKVEKTLDKEKKKLEKELQKKAKDLLKGFSL